MQTGWGKSVLVFWKFNQLATRSGSVVLLLALLLLVPTSTHISTANRINSNRSPSSFAVKYLPLNPSEEPATDSASAYYTANVKTQVIESICLGCHVTGGLASSTNLIFALGEDEANLEAIRLSKVKQR